MKHPDSVAKMVEHDHEVLHHTVHELAEFMDEAPPRDGFGTWKLDLLWKLRDFQNSLQKHFDLEEEGAYKAELLRLAPQVAGQLGHLEEEHRDIIVALTAVIDGVKAIYVADAPAMPSVRAGFRTILETLETHEAEERTLIQDVFYQDYGVGD